MRISVDYDNTFSAYHGEAAKGMMRKFPLTFMCFPEWLAEFIHMANLAEAHYHEHMRRLKDHEDEHHYLDLIREALKNMEDKKK